MATEPIAYPVRLARLLPEALVETLVFLGRDPVLNVFLEALVLRDALAHPRDEYWGAWRGDELAALLYLGMDSGLMAPVGEDPEALDALARCAARRAPGLPGRRHLVGERAALLRFERILRARLPAPRLARDQLYLAADRASLAPYRLPELRPACAGDEEMLFDSGVALRREELEEDPRSIDESAYRRHVQIECRDGSTFLWSDAAGLRFRASVGALSASVAQLAAVYTPPEHRGRGVATRGLGELCHRLLDRVTHVCLFVNDHNRTALALYRKLGFRLHAPWRSLFWSPRP